MFRRKSEMKGRKSAQWVLVCASLAAVAAPGWAKAFEDGDCLLCHGDKTEWDLSKPETARLYIVPASYEGSVHADLSCTDCHDAIEDLPHAEKLSKVNCASC